MPGWLRDWSAVSWKGTCILSRLVVITGLEYLETAAARDLFEDALQKAHLRYRFDVIGYVVMPEHVHLLVSEPWGDLLAVGLQGLKL